MLRPFFILGAIDSPPAFQLLKAAISDHHLVPVCSFTNSA
jgi:hypothetical protein